MINPTTASENLFFTTVRIETIYPDNKVGYGTGFLLSIDFKGDRKSIFLITNKHVIEGGAKWRIPFNLSNENTPDDKPLIGEQTGADIGNPQYMLRNGEFVKTGLKNIPDIWIRHDKYDIAITDFTPIYARLVENKKTPFIRAFNYNHFPKQEDIENKIDAIEEVLIVGYPNALYDSNSLIPIVRQGITATPFSIDFENEPKFLIDASIFPGSSGSPVLILDRNLQYRKGNWNLKPRSYLLGIVSSTHIRKEYNEVFQRDIPVHLKNFVESKQMIDLGVVYKSSIIKEMIDNIINK